MCLETTTENVRPDTITGLGEQNGIRGQTRRSRSARVEMARTRATKCRMSCQIALNNFLPNT